jgi:ABC-type polysaccharide/polyol phosphate export permease
MTPADHNKTIGILHLVYGGFSVAMMGVMVALFGSFFGLAGSAPSRGDEPPVFLLAIMMSFMFVVYVVLAVPSFIGGYGLLKRKKWAKVMAIVAAIVAAMSFPFGTALCVYTLWFLFGEKGRSLYDRPAYILPPPPPLWTSVPNRERQREYVPPSTPPDWR